MRLALLLLLCGCKQLLGFEDLAPDDANNDGPSTDGAGFCVGSDNSLTGEICVVDVAPPLQLEGELDTTSDTSCNRERADVCLIAAQSIEVASLRVRGSRPLVLWSTSTILVRESATLDIRSGDAPGPGANDADCPAVDGAFTAVGTPFSGTGGCGGPFGTRGGNGGDSNVPNTAMASVQCSEEAVTLDRVRGGCAGGPGGLAVNLGVPNGGDSAGGVYLMAATSITVAGVIDARGSPGSGAPAAGEVVVGGGGGGSGGLIGLDAPSIALDDAVLNALGAGGASGVGLAGGPQAGSDGKDANLAPPIAAGTVPGNVNSNFGGSGGQAGGSVEMAQTGGGGGGGGGDGYIIAIGTVVAGSAQIAPPLRSL